jgi:hypothetical protein
MNVSEKDTRDVARIWTDRRIPAACRGAVFHDQIVLADSRTMTALRSGWRVQLAKASRSPTSAMDSILARFPGIIWRDH